jgi:hypothetical protein
MSWKRYAVALFSGFVVVVLFDILWNAVLLHDVYVQAARFWLPMEELNRLVPVGFLIMLGIMALSGLLFIRFGGAGILRGLEFGLLLGLTAFVGTLGFITMVPWPKSLIAAMAFQTFANNVLTGLFFGWLYRPRQAQAERRMGQEAR